MSKLFRIMLVLLVLTVILSSCHNNSPERTYAEKNNEKNEIDKNESINDKESDTTSDADENIGLFDKYTVTKIYPFYNGLAMFVVNNGSNNSCCGYVDISGNVVIEPIYAFKGDEAGRQGFKYGCTRLMGMGFIDYIFDKEGNKLFSEDSGTSIGEISGGYFSIQKTTSTGYTLTYYRASDFKIVATFEDCFENRAISADTGDFLIYDENQDKVLKLNISNYDSSFKPEVPLNVDFDIEQHETYKDYAYSIGWAAQTQNGIIATLSLSSSNRTLYSIVKADGTVLLEPQSKIRLIGQFSNELCLAQDAETKKFGYIDIYGNWKIQPTYTSGMVFNEGYAVVDEIFVIDTTGKLILGPTK